MPESIVRRDWVLPDARWRDRFELERLDHGWRLTGRIRNQRPHSLVDSSFEGFYQVETDADWITAKAVLSIVRGYRSAEIMLTRDEHGNWFDGDREPVPQIDGATDIDLFLTPATNTLPIRREGLPVGASRRVAAALVYLGDDDRLEVRALDQRYERLDDRTWRYSSFDRGDEVFNAELTVDEYGVITSYGELWQSP